MVMDRMRAAGNKPEEEPHDLHKTNEFKPQKLSRKSKGSDKPKKASEIMPKDAEINNQAAGSETLRDIQNHSATHLDSITVQTSPELTEPSKDRDPEATDQKRRDKLDWFSTWDED